MLSKRITSNKHVLPFDCLIVRGTSVTFFILSLVNKYKRELLNLVDVLSTYRLQSVPRHGNNKRIQHTSNTIVSELKYPTYCSATNTYKILYFWMIHQILQVCHFSRVYCVKCLSYVEIIT